MGCCVVGVEKSDDLAHVPLFCIRETWCDLLGEDGWEWRLGDLGFLLQFPRFSIFFALLCMSTFSTAELAMAAIFMASGAVAEGASNISRRGAACDMTVKEWRGVERLWFWLSVAGASEVNSGGAMTEITV